MHLNIEQLSIISFPGPALEMKGKQVERPGLVKRFKSADICIPLKIKCTAFVVIGLFFDMFFVTMILSFQVRKKNGYKTTADCFHRPFGQ